MIDPVFFGMKRAYYATLRFSRPRLAKLGLTPARYDVLRMIERWGQASQVWVRNALGVASSTLSRMLRSLEELGWVSRSDDFFDRRTRECQLTKAGQAKLLEATRLVAPHAVIAMDEALTSHYGRPVLTLTSLAQRDRALTFLERLQQAFTNWHLPRSFNPPGFR